MGGKFHILLYGKVVHQVIKLKYEAYVITAVVSKAFVIVFHNVFTVNKDLSFRRTVNAAEHIKHSGLSRAACADDGDELAFFNGEVDAVRGVYYDVAVFISFIYVFKFYKTHVVLPLLKFYYAM